MPPEGRHSETFKLAAAVIAILTLRRVLTARFDLHRRRARWTLPIWLYVKVIGVLVYMMLISPVDLPLRAPSDRLVRCSSRLPNRGDAQSVVPGHIVVAAACAAFISATNRPHGRVMHKIAPPEANTLESDLNRLCQGISPIRTRLRAQR
jgi:hypothetical protein